MHDERLSASSGHPIGDFVEIEVGKEHVSIRGLLGDPRVYFIQEFYWVLEVKVEVYFGEEES